MTDHDLLAGTIAGKLRLLPDVQQLYPARPSPAHPVRTIGALIAEVSDDPAVSVTGDGPFEIEAGVGIAGTTGAIEAGREGIATILSTLPAGSSARIRFRIAAID